MSENHGEPWAAVAGVGSLPGIRDTPGNVVSDRVFNGRARRITAAVNACAGIPTAALESGAVADLLGACESVVGALRGPLPANPANVIALLEGAIARAKGES